MTPEPPVEIVRARQLFQFLKAFAERRVPKQRVLAQHLWSLGLNDLPQHPAIVVGSVIIATEGEDIEDIDGEGAPGPLLQVSKPQLTAPPPPPEAVKDYLVSGWKDAEESVEVLPSRNLTRDGQTVTEYFEDDPERVAALATWNKERDRWAAAEIPAVRAMKVYEKLYDLRGRIELQSEQVELILGDGRLRWAHPEGTIDHPVLLQRVELEFDTDHNEFRVTDADRPPELYGTVLTGGDGVSPNQLQTLKQELEHGAFHPLAGTDTSAFLRRLAAVLGPRAEFVPDRPSAPQSNDAIVGRDPFLFLRVRPPGFPAAFDRVLEDLETRTILPPGLTRVLGVDHGVDSEIHQATAAPWTEPLDILLSKPANEQQVQIARVLEQKKAVLVQGPPGTGKSHTIANLIGHLVAHGKRVLVTSHTTKALRVLREQVVDTLRPLCVSVLENDLAGRTQLEESVRGILSRLTTSSDDSLSREADDLATTRSLLNEEIGRIVRDLHAVRLAEYEPIVFGGQSEEPAKAASWVREHAANDGWIPGPVESGAPLSVDSDCLADLYATSGTLTREEEEELAAGLPAVGVLMESDQFEAATTEALYSEPDALTALWDRAPAENDIEALEELERVTRRAVVELDSFAPWQRALVGEGYDKSSGIEMWQTLTQMIEEARGRWDRARPILVEYAVDKTPQGQPHELGVIAGQILSHLDSGRSLGTLRLLWRSKWRTLIQGSLVNGKNPSTRGEFNAIRVHFSLEDGRTRLATRWHRQAEAIGLPKFDSLPSPKEPTLAEFAGEFDGLLQWWDSKWGEIENRARGLGFRWKMFRSISVAMEEPLRPFDRDVELLSEGISVAFAARVAAARGLMAARVLSENARAVSLFRGPVCTSLRQAISTRDAAAHRRAMSAMVRLTEKRPLFDRRQSILAKLETSAPNWAKAVRSRSHKHGESQLPGDPLDAWKWAQLNQEILRRSTLDEVELTQRLTVQHKRLRETTVDLIDRKAWLGQVRRVDLRAQQALNGWAQLQKRIGRGTGRRAPMLQAEARKRLVEAQSAVPVWIMPLSRVAEAVDPVSGRFDVVIIDEASQCDINGLLTWYLVDCTN